MNGLKHGHGVLRWLDGTEFIGGWEKDYAKGKG